jgi:hypothetical protein
LVQQAHVRFCGARQQPSLYPILYAQNGGGDFYESDGDALVISYPRVSIHPAQQDVTGLEVSPFWLAYASLDEKRKRGISCFAGNAASLVKKYLFPYLKPAWTRKQTMSPRALSATLCFRRVAETGKFSGKILFLLVLLFNLCVREWRNFVSSDTRMCFAKHYCQH